MTFYQHNPVTTTTTWLIVVALISLNPVKAAEKPTHIVEIRDLAFYPADIKVKPGDTVRWINKDIVPHTATAINKHWDSNFIDVKAQWQIVINERTVENYYCLYHPSMKAHLSILK